MNSARKLILLLATILSLTASIALANDKFHIDAYGESCRHGLHFQPNGPFAAFLFCDDALGSNIGIILTEPGAGPGNIELPPQKEWPHWFTYKRFWQEPDWATHVTDLLWSPSLKYVYVSSSAIYGYGGLYKLDLVNRTAVKMFPGAQTIEKLNKAKASYFTRIRSVDVASRRFSATLYKYDNSNEEIKVSTEELQME